jgi:hypothetical protein
LWVSEAGASGSRVVAAQMRLAVLDALAVLVDEVSTKTGQAQEMRPPAHLEHTRLAPAVLACPVLSGWNCVAVRLGGTSGDSR